MASTIPNKARLRCSHLSCFAIVHGYCATGQPNPQNCRYRSIVESSGGDSTPVHKEIPWDGDLIPWNDQMENAGRFVPQSQQRLISFVGGRSSLPQLVQSWLQLLASSLEREFPFSLKGGFTLKWIYSLLRDSGAILRTYFDKDYRSSGPPLFHLPLANSGSKAVDFLGCVFPWEKAMGWAVNPTSSVNRFFHAMIEKSMATVFSIDSLPETPRHEGSNSGVEKILWQRMANYQNSVPWLLHRMPENLVSQPLPPGLRSPHLIRWAIGKPRPISCVNDFGWLLEQTNLFRHG